MNGTVYSVETPKEVFYSNRKLDAQYKHLEYLYRDRARYKEMTQDQFNKYKESSKKKFIQLEESV